MAKSFDRITSEDEILEVFKTMKAEAEEKVKDRAKTVKRNRMVYMGNHYLRSSDDGYEIDDRAPSWRLRVTRDLVGPMVETLRPILMRGVPKYEIEADFGWMQSVIVSDDGQEMPVPDLTDGQLAQRLESILEAEHDFRGEGIEVAKLLCDVLVGGTAYRKVIYNRERNRVELPILDFENVLPDPYGTMTDFADHKYVIVKTEMDAADIERRFGVKEEDFGSDDEMTEGNGLVRRVTSFMRGKQTNMTTDEKWKRKRYPVYELFYREASPELGIQSDKPIKSLKYPSGRVTVVINDKKVVYDKPNHYWHGEFPVVCYVGSPMPHQLFGKSDVDSLVPIQNATNVLYNMVIANAMLSANNQWIYEEGALAAEEITNQPGLMIPVSPGKMGAIQRLDPARLPSDVFNMVKELEQFGQSDITGVQDVLMGREPSANSSGVLANTLQSAALTRQGFKMQSLDQSYRRQARLELGLVQQFADFQDPRYLKGEGLRRMDMGEWMMWSEAMRDLVYDVKVESQSDIPHNLTARLNFAMQLLQTGVYDITEFLNFTGLKVRPELKDMLVQQGGGAATQGSGGAGQSQGGLTGQPNLGAGVPQQALPAI
tara:strand:- start:5746 stop:7545 length:1800 start_codon:yes stop_codon:yes gene_type:complete